MNKEHLTIIVKDFTEEEKKLTQDAFFKLGYEWIGGDIYPFLGSSVVLYTTQDIRGYSGLFFSRSLEDVSGTVLTLEELLTKAGMEDKIPRKHPKPDDKVNVELTLKELLAIAYIMGDCPLSIFENVLTLHHKLETKLKDSGVIPRDLNWGKFMHRTYGDYNIIFRDTKPLNPTIKEVFEDLKPKEPKKELVEFNGKMYDKKKLEQALKGLDEAGE